MTMTQAQLVSKVLSLLIATPTGQPDAAEDVARVEAAIPGYLGDLQRRGITYLPNLETVPDAAFQWLAMGLSQFVANEFGAQFDPTTLQFSATMLLEQSHNRLPSQPVEWVE